MAGQSSAMFGWRWGKVSVLGSQVFGQALMESCAFQAMPIIILYFLPNGFHNLGMYETKRGSPDGTAKPTHLESTTSHCPVTFEPIIRFEEV